MEISQAQILFSRTAVLAVLERQTMYRLIKTFGLEQTLAKHNKINIAKLTVLSWHCKDLPIICKTAWEQLGYRRHSMKRKLEHEFTLSESRKQ